MDPRETADRPGHAALIGVIDDAVGDAGVVVEEVRVGGAAAEPTVEVVLDRASGTEGLTLDEIAELSGRISAALDALGDEVPGVGTGEYLLEVSTAGVERPLTRPRHFERNVGRVVRVSVDGAEPVLARLLNAGPDAVELAEVRPGAKKGMPSKELAPQRVALDRLGPAVVQVEWSTAQQAGEAAETAQDTAEHTEA